MRRETFTEVSGGREGGGDDPDGKEGWKREEAKGGQEEDAR